MNKKKIESIGKRLVKIIKDLKRERKKMVEKMKIGNGEIEDLKKLIRMIE